MDEGDIIRLIERQQEQITELTTAFHMLCKTILDQESQMKTEPTTREFRSFLLSLSNTANVYGVTGLEDMMKLQKELKK